MKIAFILVFSLLTTGVLAESPNLRRHAEYQISPAALITFSSTGITARLCSGCQPTQWLSIPRTELKEFNRPITVERATELYVRKSQFDLIYLGLDRQTGSIDYIDFGGLIGDDH